MNHLKYLGHSCFSIHLEGYKILIDPFIRPNPLTKNLVDVDNLEADFILLTHGHSDHVADAHELSRKNGAPIIANFEVATWFEEKDCTVFGMNIGGKRNFGFGDVRMVNAIHSSNMPDGSYGGTSAGFLITSGSHVLYFAGDTALTMDMKLIPAYFGKPTLAILPIGGYFTMNHQDALIASDMIECNSIIGCHFNTFPPITIDKQEVLQSFEDQGKKIILPEINEIINL
ncbi:MAG TPA: metal-dependent hydrolase [Saprospiraceae bacterium]|jgi:L-ascorbate metabolism protein UlaG (beta-lactamase superfamily)|nr:metal-dependent hydrolase [Saprospiraceae bacterium]HQW94806.1 metal-dependent hydrolase [Saprospiraceae bacterium]HRG43431.1 metal-dependent hydrolase [Saprospiraceae bacterium]